jgi:hypothetical protein
MTRFGFVVAGALPAFVLATQALAAPTAGKTPQIVVIPSGENPPLPPGLKVTCMKNGTELVSSPLCPVVKYRGITTWAYSFIDNRVSLALVSYDAKKNVVRNVTLDGTRYVWQVGLAPGAGTVTFTGQSNASVVANLEDLGSP